MLMFRFLSEVEKIDSDGKTLKNKDLAAKLGVSPSYITQLFNGGKMMNFTMLAKIQKAFNITFEITVRNNSTTPANAIPKKKSKTALYANHLSVAKADYKKEL